MQLDGKWSTVLFYICFIKFPFLNQYEKHEYMEELISGLQ
jgi:hypothetical protein